MKKRFDFKDTNLKGLRVILRQPIVDVRGSFQRVFCEKEFSEERPIVPINQINLSYTKGVGTIRGFHFQYPPYSETKIITCLKGRVFDVAVDLRTNSKTFLKWFGIELSAENYKSLIIPEGFAHGFQSLTNDCELLYIHTNYYNADAEGGIHFQDPKISVKWPLPFVNISKRDQSHPLLDSTFKGIKL
jgi:dTDP-4-dehydrorhamnose 3,5-epimerase